MASRLTFPKSLPFREERQYGGGESKDFLDSPLRRPRIGCNFTPAMHDAETEIIRLLDETERPLKHIAAEAGVSYERLKNWRLGRTESLWVRDAERVYQALTGRQFIQP